MALLKWFVLIYFKKSQNGVMVDDVGASNAQEGNELVEGNIKKAPSFPWLWKSKKLVVLN